MHKEEIHAPGSFKSIHLDIPFEKTSVPEFFSPRHRPELYPGTRPNWSFCFTGEHILPIRTEGKILQVKNESDTWLDLESFVNERTGVSLSKRFAVVAVGSNACPARLADPDKYGESRDIAIPVLHGRINNVVSVYTPRITSYHSIPSTIMGAPGTQSKLWVTLLIEKELHRMDQSEGRGRGYELVEFQNSVFNIRENIFITPLSAYYQPLGLRHPETGQPVLLDCFEVNEGNGVELPRMSQPGVLEYISGITGHITGLKEKNNFLLHHSCIPLPMPENAEVLDDPLIPSEYVSINKQYKIQQEGK
ncbi:MAG: hypothetical protein GY950_11455 [bacterium]|nr:hypothetical protein [bacterium]